MPYPHDTLNSQLFHVVIQAILISSNVLGYTCSLSLHLSLCLYAGAFCGDYCSLIDRIRPPSKQNRKQNLQSKQLELNGVVFLEKIDRFVCAQVDSTPLIPESLFRYIKDITSTLSGGIFMQLLCAQIFIALSFLQVDMVMCFRIEKEID